jgi:hypothetical protein
MTSGFPGRESSYMRLMLYIRGIFMGSILQGCLGSIACCDKYYEEKHGDLIYLISFIFYVYYKLIFLPSVAQHCNVSKSQVWRNFCCPPEVLCNFLLLGWKVEQEIILELLWGLQQIFSVKVQWITLGRTSADTNLALFLLAYRFLENTAW